MTGEQFCHYTDLSSLKGILEANEFWLSVHRFLNAPPHTNIRTGKKLPLISLAYTFDKMRMLGFPCRSRKY